MSFSTPAIKTFQELKKRMMQVISRETGVSDTNANSAFVSIVEAAALSDFQSQGNLIAVLNSNDIDRAEGVDLDNLGLAAGISRPQAIAAIGTVTIQHSTIKKVATKVYAGTAAPPIGSMTINISSRDNFSDVGSIYLGRGSNNVEGPIIYISISPVGNYFQILLSAATTKNHNVNETVILAQGGDRAINAGLIVQTKENATSPSVMFSILNNATLPDGEDTITDVPVFSSQVGKIGNIPANAISQFAAEPFPGAIVFNPTAYVTGRDALSDPDYRLLIKEAAQTKTKGTDLAITSAAKNTTSTDDNKAVASASIQKPSRRDEPSILYIDDRTAYQPIFSGQGFEAVIDSANGGEKFLKLQKEDMVKAILVTSNAAPFSLTGSYVLAIKVGSVLSEHTFSSTDFEVQNAADTFEVVNSVNANAALLFSARASNDSKQIAFFAKDFMNEDLEVTTPSNSLATDANAFLGLSINLTYTLRLYKNDVLLIKDGKTPTIYTRNQSTWSPIASPKTLIIQIDQQANPTTYTIQNSDFAPFGFAVMSETVPLSVWAKVINSVIPGVQAVIEGSKLKITSNKGAKNEAKLYISGGTLKSLVFDDSAKLPSIGKLSDYALNRSTGQIELTSSLVAGDSVTAGSKNTKAFLSSAQISTGSTTLIAGSSTTVAPTLWIVLDDSNSTGLTSPVSSGSIITVSNPGSNIWRFTSSEAAAFTNILPGDFVVISDNAIKTENANFIGHFRVAASTATTFDIYVTQSLGTVFGPTTLTGNKRIAFTRSSTGTVQPIQLPSGLNNLTAIAASFNSQASGASASVVNGKFLKLQSNTFGANGTILIAGISSSTEPLGFNAGDIDYSTVSHTAFSESLTTEDSIPSFVHDIVATGNSTIPPLNFVSTLNLENQGIDRNELIKFLNSYGHESSNKNAYTQLQTLAATNVSIRAESRLKDIVVNDRYYVSQPYNFNALDNLVIIIDKDSVNKSFNIPLGRKGKVYNAISQNQFLAYDADLGPTANWSNSFGDAFNFQDFKVHIRARQVIDPTGPNNKMLLRANDYGPSGETTRFGIDYPTLPAQGITSTVLMKGTTDIMVFLSSGAERLGGAWDSTTQFDVSNIVSNTWRYSHNGIGTTPNFTSAGIIVGDIVNVSGTQFNTNNIGVFKISAVTNTYFEVTGFFNVAENNIQLNFPSDLRFYPLAANTASAVEAYVDANLASYLTIDQLQSGAGAITTSTFNDQSGMSSFVKLTDGENWFISSNIGTTSVPVNAFTLKKNLNIAEADPDYTLVNEIFYIVPTRAEQLVRYLNKFSVTGLPSVANISTSDDASKLQIYSTVFGTTGAVQVTGGSANSGNAEVVGSGSNVGDITLRGSFYGANIVGSTVTLNSLEKHSSSVGDTIIVSGVRNNLFNVRAVVSAVTDKTIQFNKTYSYPAPLAQPSGFSRSSGIVTTTTAAAHGLTVGDEIHISGAANTAFDGYWIVASVPSAMIFSFNTSVGNYALQGVGAIRSSNVVTLATVTPHDIAAGDQIVVSGVTDTSFNGTFIVTSVTSNTITYTQTGIDSISGSGSIGTVNSGGGAIDEIYSGLGSVALPYTRFNIPASARAGFQVGQYIKLANNQTLNKSIGLTASSQIQLQNIGGFGRITLTSPGTFQSTRSHSGGGTTKMKLEKQGQFICLSFTGTGTAPNFVAGGVEEGDWIRLPSTSNFNLANQGTFQIIRMFGNNSLYIINDSATEEEVILNSAGDLSFYSYDSVLPGDQFIIASDVLGALNQGTYTVKETVFPTATQFDVTVAFAVPQAATPLANASNTVTVKEKQPFSTYRKIINLALDPADPNSYTVIIDTDRVGGKLAASVGGSIASVGKMNFPTTVRTGEDSYKYYGGLISAVGKKIRGQASDPVQYPGVAATGAYIEITAPLPREIVMSIVIKNLTATSFSVLKGRVQNAVAAYVNSLDVGQSIVFSQIVSAIQAINGVQALAISAPTYDQTNLQIVINNNEKAVVRNVNNITVSLAN